MSKQFYPRIVRRIQILGLGSTGGGGGGGGGGGSTAAPPPPS